MKANIQKGMILVALTILGAVVLSGAVAADDTTTNENVITDPPQENPADEGTGNMDGATDPEDQESGSSDGNSEETSPPEETPADPTEADPPKEDTGDSGNSADPVEETESSDGNSVEPFQVPEDDPADLSITKTFLDASWNPITTAHIGDLVYVLINVVNNGPDPATGVAMTDLPTTGLTPMGTYWTSYDNGTTWNYNDGWFSAEGGLWFILGMDAGDSYWLAALYQVTATGIIENRATVASLIPDPNPDNNSVTAELDVLEADLYVEKYFLDWETFNPISEANYLDDLWTRVVVENLGPDTALDVYVSDYLPTGMDVNSIWRTSYDGGLTWNYFDPNVYFIWDPIFNNWDVIWDAGDMDAGDIFIIDIGSTVEVSDSLLYNEAEAESTTYDPDPENNWDYAWLEIPPAADIGVEKTLAPFSDVNYLGEIGFIITVYNNGPDTATDIIVTDTLPEGLEWYGYGGWFSQYKSFALTGYNPITREITWKILDPIAPGEFGILNIWGVYVNTSNVTVYNTVEVEGEDYDYNLLNNEDILAIEIPPAADIWVTKEVIENTTPYDTINYLDYVSYLITVGNNGPDTATGVEMTENINFTQFQLDTWTVSWDGGITWISEDPSYNPLTGIWDIGTLETDDPNPELKIIGWIIDSDTTMTNQATVEANEYDPFPENNTDYLEFDVPPAADLEVIKDTSNYTPTIGSLFYFTVEVFNWGPDAAENVVVADFMDPGIILIEAIPSMGYFDYGDWTWNIDELPAGEGAELILICMVDEIGPLTNEVEVYSDTYDPDMSNNYSEVTIIGQPKPHAPCKPCVPCVQAGKVPMKPTGSPLAGLALAVLAILGGLVSTRR